MQTNAALSHYGRVCQRLTSSTSRRWDSDVGGVSHWNRNAVVEMLGSPGLKGAADARCGLCWGRVHLEIAGGASAPHWPSKIHKHHPCYTPPRRTNPAVLPQFSCQNRIRPF